MPPNLLDGIIVSRRCDGDVSGLHQADGLGALKFHGGQILQVEADVVVAGLGVIGLLQEGRAFVHGLLHLVPVIHYGLAANPDEAAILKCADLQMGILHKLGVGGLVGAAAELQLILKHHGESKGAHSGLTVLYGGKIEDAANFILKLFHGNHMA